MKILFIDDNKDWLSSIKRFFRGKDNVFFAECHSAQEALDAVANIQPNIIFLDHSLTEGGNEGLEIVKALQGSGVKIYSTTAAKELADLYAQYGIEWVGKDIFKIRKIIAG